MKNILFIFLLIISINAFTQSSYLCKYHLSHETNQNKANVEEDIFSRCFDNIFDDLNSENTKQIINLEKEIGRSPFIGLSENEDEYYTVILKLLDDMSLSPNFVYKNCNSINNAYAGNIPNTVNGIDRLILTDKNFLDKIRNEYFSEYPVLSIILHEAGHHLNNHTFLSDKLSNHEKELQADEFSGYMLCKLGATLSEALIAINKFGNENDTYSHPNKLKRTEAIKKGWNKCNLSNIDYSKLNYENLLIELKKKETQSVDIIKIAEFMKSYSNYSGVSYIAWVIKASYYTVLNLYAESNYELYDLLFNVSVKNNWKIDEQEIYLRIGDNFKSMNLFLDANITYDKVINNYDNVSNNNKAQAIINKADILLELNQITPNEFKSIIDKYLGFYINVDVRNSYKKAFDSKIALKNTQLLNDEKNIKFSEKIINESNNEIIKLMGFTFMYVHIRSLLNVRRFKDVLDIINTLNLSELDFNDLNEILGLKIEALYSLKMYNEAQKINSKYPDNLANKHIKQSLLKGIYFN